MPRTIILPTSRRSAINFNPSFMVVFGFPKSGKSTCMAALDDNLILSLDPNGYKALDVMLVDCKDIYDVFATREALKKKMEETGKKPYRFITIDNATRLEDMCVLYANALYRKTQMGQNWGYLRDKEGNPVRDTKTGKMVPDPQADVRQLPNGAGYLYLREALKEVVHMFQPYCETLILVCHVKDKQINLNGQETTRLAVDLAGKLSDIICGEADAVGYLYREGNKTIMSFMGGSGDIREARPLHLRGKSFVVCESDSENHLTVDMSKIFIDGQGDTAGTCSAPVGKGN